jgi:hypothetical protein
MAEEGEENPRRFLAGISVAVVAIVLPHDRGPDDTTDAKIDDPRSKERSC